MAKREPRERPPASSGDPSGGGLAALLQAKGLVASGTPDVAEPPSAPAVAQASGATPPFQGQRRLVLAMERAGRGGRTVTVVRGVEGGAAVLDDAARTLRKALGTGVSVEVDHLVIQGDQRDRLRPWLLAQGVRDVRG